MKFLSKLVLFISSLVLFSSCQDMEDIILFNSNRNGNSDIFLMNGDGKNITQITDSKEDEWAAVWVDENHISFLRQTTDSIQIIKKNLINNNEEILEQTSPCPRDDKNIVYSQQGLSYAYICNNEIILKRSSSTIESKLNLNSQGNVNYLSWGNENDLIFTESNNLGSDIYRVNINDNLIEALTQNRSNDERADINLTSNKIAFSSNRNNKNNQDIYIKDLNSNNIQNITNSSGNELIAKWNKKGSKIYYGSNKDGNWEIYVYDLKTRNTTRLTNNSAFDGDPQIRKF